jgi:tripartite motif-containing protein 71
VPVAHIVPAMPRRESPCSTDAHARRAGRLPATVRGARGALPPATLLLGLLVAACGGAGGGAPPNPSDHAPALVAVADPAACPGGAWATGAAPAPVGAASARRGSAPASGTVAGIAAVRGSGACPYRSVEVLGTVGEGVMRQPEALAVSPSGRVYVGDQFTHKVQMFTSTGIFVGQWGSYGAGPGQFGAVGGLAIDRHGDVYLVDCTHDRIEEFTATGDPIRTWGSTGTAADQLRLGGGSGPSEPPGGGIAVSDRYVYVADTRNDRIVRYSLDGSDPRVIAGRGTAPGEVMRPKGLAVTSGGAGEALYVADNGNGRVQELTPGGRYVAQARSFPASPSTFQNAYDVAVGGNAVYVVDDNHGRIVKFTRDLHFVTTFSGEGGLALSPFIRAVATDSAGTVYVADAHDNDVVAFNADGRALRRWGISANDPGQFVAPVDVALGPRAASLVVESYGGLVHMRSLRPMPGRLIWAGGGDVFLGSLWFGPTAAAFAPDGTVWVTDPQNNAVRHLTLDGRFLNAAGDPHGQGAPSGPGRTGWAAPSEPGASGGPVRYAGLVRPEGLAVDRAGDVLVSDTGHVGLYKLSPDGRTLAVWGTGGQGEAKGSPAHLGSPRALALGLGGSLYVADSQRARVARVDAASGALLALWGGRGDGPGRFEQPAGIAVDGAGHVFVSDAGLDRIQEFTPGGRLIAAWGSPGSGPGELSDPGGMEVDCRGDLLVADSANNRVQVFAGAGSPSPSLPCAR